MGFRVLGLTQSDGNLGERSPVVYGEGWGCWAVCAAAERSKEPSRTLEPAVRRVASGEAGRFAGVAKLVELELGGQSDAPGPGR